MRNQAPPSSPVESRLAVLRFPPHFFGAAAMSPLGDLSSLWQRLTDSEREDLVAFERAFREAQRHELRGDSAEAAKVHRRLIDQFPRFRAIPLERLQAMGLPAEAPPEEAPDD